MLPHHAAKSGMDLSDTILNRASSVLGNHLLCHEQSKQVPRGDLNRFQPPGLILIVVSTFTTTEPDIGAFLSQLPDVSKYRLL